MTNPGTKDPAFCRFFKRNGTALRAPAIDASDAVQRGLFHVARRGDDDLDLILSNMDAGLRLLSYLHARTEEEDRTSVAPGEAFLLEALIAESAQARDAYERCRENARLAAAQ